MKRLLFFYKTFRILIIVMFLFPFVLIRCGGPSDEEIEARKKIESNPDRYKQEKEAIRISDSLEIQAKIYNDLLNQANAKIDTIKRDTSGIKPIQTANDTIKQKNSTSEIFTNFLFGKDDHYTGIGVIYLILTMFRDFIGVFNAFILIVLSSIFANRRKWRNFRTILIIDISGLIFLSLVLDSNILWGFWVCYFSWIGLISIDIIALLKNNKLTKTDCQSETENNVNNL